MAVDTFDVYKMYKTIQFHFKLNSSYDYKKYGMNGLVHVANWNKFLALKNSEKRVYTKLAKTYGTIERLEEFFSTSFAVIGDVSYVGELLNNSVFSKVIHKHDKFLYSNRIFTNDIRGLKTILINNNMEFKQLFNDRGDNDVPFIEILHIQRIITFETLVVLNKILKWTELTKSTNVQWIKSKNNIEKYEPFMPMNSDYLKIIENNI